MQRKSKGPDWMKPQAVSKSKETKSYYKTLIEPLHFLKKTESWKHFHYTNAFPAPIDFISIE